MSRRWKEWWPHPWRVGTQLANPRCNGVGIGDAVETAPASFLACYITQGRVDAAVALNRGKDIRRIMPVIKARRAVNVTDLQDERIDLRSLQHRP